MGPRYVPERRHQGDEHEAEGQRYGERVVGQVRYRPVQYGRHDHGGAGVDEDEGADKLGHRRGKYV